MLQRNISTRYISIRPIYIQLPLAASEGIVTIRTVLSALPEISLSDVGLKRNVVGGKSCAFNMLNCGYWRVPVSLWSRLLVKVILTARNCASTTPTVRSDEPKASHLPSGLRRTFV